MSVRPARLSAYCVALLDPPAWFDIRETYDSGEPGDYRPVAQPALRAVSISRGYGQFCDQFVDRGGGDIARFQQFLRPVERLRCRSDACPRFDEVGALNVVVEA